MPNIHDGKIVLLEPPVCNLDQYRNDMGELAICIPRSVPFQIVKKADEITDLDKLTSDYSSTFDLPIDNTTRKILGNVQYRIVKGVSIFRAVLLVGDMVLLDGFLTINTSIDKLTSNIITYSVQVIGTHQTWKETLRNKCLQDLELGSIVWNEANILDLMNNNSIYIDGGDTIYPMLADFGKFHNEKYLGQNSVTIYDIRFLVFDLAIIKEMFRIAGYCVESIFLNSEYFRRKAVYALRPNFYDIENDGGDDLRSDALVELSADQLITAPPSSPGEVIKFDNIIYNNTSKYNNVNWRYTNNTTHPLDGVFIRLNMTVCNYGAIPSAFSVRINMISGVGNVQYIIPELLIDPLITTVPVGGCISVTDLLIDWSQVLRDQSFNTGYIPSGGYLEVVILWINAAPTVIAGSTVEFLFGGKHWYENDLIPIASVLNCTTKLYDILLDWRNEYGLRFKTNEETKTVRIEPRPARYTQYQTYTQPEKQVKGFEVEIQDVNEVWDITDSVDICQEITKQFEPQDNFTAIKFKFKDTTDSHPAYEPYKLVGNELWSKQIQKGNTNTVNVLEIAMNVIEPTLNQFVKRISADNSLDYRAIYIPVMWDGSPDADGSVPDAGVNYEMREFHVFGMVEQVGFNPQGNAPVSRRWKFENVTYIDVPTIAQALPPDMPIKPFFTNILPIINNIFGDNVFNTYTKNLVTTFYPDALDDLQEGIELTLNIRLSTLAFKCNDIRSLVRIFSQNMPLIHLNNYYKIVRIDMPFNQADHAKITLIPKLPCQ